MPWARATYQAVAQVVPRLLGLLDDDDPQVRQATAYLVAWFPQHAAAGLGRLRARLGAEPDSNAAAAMVVAVGLLAGAHRQAGDVPVLAELLGASEPLVRWAAAIALARLLVEDPPEPAVAELLGWSTGVIPQPVEAEIPFYRGELGRYALAAAVRPGPAAHQRAVEALLARLPMAGPAGDVGGLLWDLLGVTFPHDTFDLLLPRPRWERLSRLQQRVLRVVADTDRLWQRDPDDPWARVDPPLQPIRSRPTGCQKPEPNSKPTYSCRAKHVVDGDVQCGGEGAQVAVHRATRLDVGSQRRSWTPSCTQSSGLAATDGRSVSDGEPGGISP